MSTCQSIGGGCKGYTCTELLLGFLCLYTAKSERAFLVFVIVADDGDSADDDDGRRSTRDILILGWVYY